MKSIFVKFFVMILTVGFLAACGGAEAEKADATTAPATDNPATEVKAAPEADANAVDPNIPKTTMTFGEMTHDFGDIQEGDKVTHVFSFTNSGDEPLIINSAKGSCGCTVPDWPKEPIPPGGESQIKVEFNSKGKAGNQTKTVTINANTDPNPTRLTIKAQVAKAEGEAEEGK
ncbi:MAG: DUF1573 domain-containing protein [Chitinophagales bacterium]